MRTDSIFYQLFQSFPSLLFELLGLDPGLGSQYRFASQEIKETAFRLDGIFLPSQREIPLYLVDSIRLARRSVLHLFMKSLRFWWR
ncbi:Rpn family recombination-promoting nuclease/putative transposase [Thermostichus vulcanus]|uniref:DUF2887 domain-containing protein n=1 Tax=Thermostichus vulcanus str. 'Rupite' TaxID=2813851 RepID=A0ABT0CDH7_THEVL|nr:DUF2887 domain-containing protein [Thermostichus vulcanus str. 'Rupite']